jgi:chromosome segregation ATPase
MADAAHNYSRGDRAALILFGAGKCYWPGCLEPLLKKVETSYKIALEIAHIRAAKPNGQRYVRDMDDTARASFDNIIFLCVAHHKAVDDDGAEAKYSIEVLEQWKADREQGGLENLRGLRDVTEDKLVEMISTAIQERDEDVRQTLARLEQTDEEAAELLRELRDELYSLRGGQSILDPDLVAMLSHAAHDLVGLEDHAARLSDAASRLQHLEGSAGNLRDASSNLERLDNYVGILNQAAENLNQAASRIEEAGGRF